MAISRDLLADSLHIQHGQIAEAFQAAVAAATRAAERLWRRDPSAWSSDPSVQAKIADRLGWLTSGSLMKDSIGRLRAFADEVRGAGTTDVVLLGMGGSSLAPEVLRSVIGVNPGWPRFRMLDSTDPDAVRSARTPPATTLYILASKSGTTIEPNSLASHFRHELEIAGIADWPRHFVAITDPETPLASRSRAERFRETFINPPDIGGRYSAISYFGLVPAALMGQDIERLLDWANSMSTAASAERGPASNPAVGLGLFIAAGVRAGRDKLTLLLPEDLEAFGLWVEQLIAESTGKNGTGVVPIAGESAATADRYGEDRLFVRIVSAEANGQVDSGIGAALRKSGAPVATLTMSEPLALGAEFVRWEIATAIAGALLGINPFDEPNVQQAKDATTALLRQFEKDGHLRRHRADAVDEGVELTLSTAARKGLGAQSPDKLLALVRERDYVAVLAYLGPDPALADEINGFRTTVRDRTRAATMVGYGPRYLHSTGQLHKGGPNTGVFVLITAAPPQDIEIPGQPFTFGTLEQAQALGDFASLDAAGRRALHVHLPSADAATLRRILMALVP